MHSKWYPPKQDFRYHCRFEKVGTTIQTIANYAVHATTFEVPILFHHIDCNVEYAVTYIYIHTHVHPCFLMSTLLLEVICIKLAKEAYCYFDDLFDLQSLAIIIIPQRKRGGEIVLIFPC